MGGRTEPAPAIRRRLAPIPIAALLMLTVLAGSTSAAKPPGITNHRVNLLWNPDDQDVIPGDTVVDGFDSSGPPFGDETAETQTPRSQIDSDDRSGKWSVYLNPGAEGPNSGRCFGTFRIHRGVIETTMTPGGVRQTVEHSGVLQLKGCVNTTKFKKAQPGPLGRLHGETTCTARRCIGGLEIKGAMRY